LRGGLPFCLGANTPGVVSASVSGVVVLRFGTPSHVVLLATLAVLQNARSSLRSWASLSPLLPYLSLAAGGRFTKDSSFPSPSSRFQAALRRPWRPGGRQTAVTLTEGESPSFDVLYQSELARNGSYSLRTADATVIAPWKVF